MKNLKKVLALVVVFAMMVSTVAFAGSVYPDVADDASYANAVRVLSSLGFLLGDDKGNFNPDNTITRAEFATICTRLLGVEGAATGTADFTDVPATHWATGYINMAQQYGIILGYGDGTFGPEDPVTYEQAVKMLVCALGYEQMATSKGGYPTGYLVTASQIGLLDDTAGTQGAGAPRSLVAQLCYNALDIPVMEQTGYGTDITYTVMKKTDDQDKVTLLTKMNIYKLGGIIAANSKVSYKGQEASVTDKGQVNFWWDDDYDSPVSAWSKKTEKDPNYAEDTYYGAELLETGDTDIEDQIGNQLIVYVKKGTSKYVVEAYELDDSSVSLVINASDLDDDNLDYEEDKTIKYYKDGATKSTKVNLSSNYTAVWNNVVKTGAYLTANLDSDASAVIELIDFNDDNKYDVVKVTEYYHAIVDEVSTNKGTVTTLDGDKLDFDTDNEDAKVTIKDINGNELSLSDIQQYDVLAMVVSSEKGAAPLKALKGAEYDSLDVIVLRDSTVTGSVSELNNDDDDVTITVGGKEYDVDEDGYNAGKIDLQSEGTFYIGITGNVVGFEGDKVSSGNYAFILSVYDDNKKTSTTPEVTLLTKDGIAEYDMASTVRFVNEEGKYTRVDMKDAYADLTTAVKNSAWKNLAAPTSGTKVRDIIYDNFAAEIDDIELTEAVVRLRTIKYKLNSSNEISELTPIYGANESDEDKYELSGKTAADATYKKTAQKLGSYLVADDAIVIKLDKNNADNSKITDVGYFVDDNIYSAIMLDKDDEGYYAGAVVYNSEAVYEDGDSIAVVLSKNDALNSDGDKIVKIEAYKDGKKVTLIFDEDELSGYGYGSKASYSDLEIGSVIIYTADSAGIVDQYDVVGTVNYDKGKTVDGEVVGASELNMNGGKTFVFDSTFKTEFAGEADYDDGDAYFLGYITSKTKNNKTVNIEIIDSISDKDETSFTITSSVNQYTLTGTKKSTTNIELDDYTYGNIDAIDGDADEEVVYTVLIRTYEGEVVDIIGFDTPEGTPLANVKIYEKAKAPTAAPIAIVEEPVVEEVAEEAKEETIEEIIEIADFDL